MRRRYRTSGPARPRHRRIKGNRLAAGGCLILLTCCVSPAWADDFYDPRTTYGDLGILEMPNARMAPDGQVAVTVGLLDKTQRYNFSFQFLPWLEGSFRYSHISRYSGPLYDRSFGLKLRLSQETENLPDISLGIRDLLGTGVYSSEYLVASKRMGDFDITAGLGWGRLASVDTFPNVFGLIFKSFNTRSQYTGGTGGTLNFGQYFHGPGMGLFGGAVWRTPVEDLNVLLEYSTDKYQTEAVSSGFKVRMPVNIGVSYKFFDVAIVSASWLYGSSYGLTVSMSTDPTISSMPQKIGPDLPQPVIRPAKEQADALTQLFDRGRPSVRDAAIGPWVQLPASASDPDTMSVKSALMSVGRGVQDVELTGRTLVVDASFGPSASSQCDRYAQIVSPLVPRLETVALSDPSDRAGRVAICHVFHAADASADSDPAPQASGQGGEIAPPQDPVDAAQKIRADVAAQALDIEALSVEPTMVWLYFSNTKYQMETEAAGRIARVLMADAPASVEIFHLVSVRNGVELRTFTIARSALERATLTYGTTQELGDAVSIAPAPLSNPVLERAQDDSYPRFHWSFGPALREGFFDPSQPLQIQILAAANVSVDVTPHLTFEGRVEANIYDNYDLNTNSNSLLPHVRSDLNLYLKDGINGIANLDAAYHARLGRDIYFEAKAGYLEDMFAGGGAQILWRPDGERLSFGADLYEVWQRDFNRLFGVQNYHVLTGHASIYYESPWYGVNFALHAGRYLAGDDGATFEISRRFSTGVEIGAFATFTNVPFSKFGEGSFDKGIYIHIPLEWALPFFSQSAYDAHIRSLIRDGGQRLDNDDSLFAETQSQSYGYLLGHLDDVIAP